MVYDRFTEVEKVRRSLSTHDQELRLDIGIGGYPMDKKYQVPFLLFSRTCPLINRQCSFSWRRKGFPLGEKIASFWNRDGSRREGGYIESERRKDAFIENAKQ